LSSAHCIAAKLGGGTDIPARGGSASEPNYFVTTDPAATSNVSPCDLALPDQLIASALARDDPRYQPRFRQKSLLALSECQALGFEADRASVY
jgi:hypothetical protein